ncbi:MAG TPA: tetraacyldisaccharide 4'-kinase [Gemmatimonadaceae bacterium]
MSVLERIWFDESLAARSARLVLAPPSWLYSTIVRIRGALYDRDLLLHRHGAAVPVLSIGNLSVGGTGKTPLAAWAAERLRAAGARPAVLLRGYGGDEPLVHATLNPDIPVIADPDRVAGARKALAAGADCAILDDGFQHRRLARVADWVLVSAEQPPEPARLLPAGPWREPPTALRRATVAVVTRKSASLEAASTVAARLTANHGVDCAIVHLTPSDVVDAREPHAIGLERLRGVRALIVAAIGAPAAFAAQVRSLGVAESDTLVFPDHHGFTETDITRIVHAAKRADVVVCTLKDAVKLAPLWPRAALPLWYVSQRAEVECGEQLLAATLATVMSARASSSSTAGVAG